MEESLWQRQVRHLSWSPWKHAMAAKGHALDLGSYKARVLLLLACPAGSLHIHTAAALHADMVTGHGSCCLSGR